MDGIINVYKEKGYTSFDVVAKLRGILHQKKIGHTGTLDPDAEGVLPVCLGKATKLCDYLTEKTKIYETVIKLGVRTDTEDISGKVLGNKPYSGDEEQLISVINSFKGEMKQIPPMYSAIKVDGKKLYELARKGITIDREARDIVIYDIKVLDINLCQGLVRINVHVSKGTYIRTLCKDIGEKLGCDACMYQLLRTKSGTFEIADSIKLETIQKLADSNELEQYVTKINEVFDMPGVLMKKECDAYVKNGNRINSEMFDKEVKPGKKAFLSTGNQDICVYYSDNSFAALYREISDNNSKDIKDYKVLKMFS